MEKEGGQRAIKALNSAKIEGKTLIVEISTIVSYLVMYNCLQETGVIFNFLSSNRRAKDIWKC